MKNPRTQLAQRLREIAVRLPVIISGTPIQNDLVEMHALMDFVCPVRASHPLIIIFVPLPDSTGISRRSGSLSPTKPA